MLRQQCRRFPFEAHSVAPTNRLEPWGHIYRSTSHGRHSCSRCLYSHPRRFIFLRVIKAYCACEGTLGHLELSVCFPTPQSVSSSLHVKEWSDRGREEDKHECLLFIPQASCLLAPRGASEPKERWLLGYRWVVAYRSESRSHCEQDRGKRRQRDGKEVEYTGSKEGRGEENGTKGDVSLSACSRT